MKESYLDAQTLIRILDRMDVRLFSLGGNAITLWDVVFVIVALAALFWFTAWLQRWATRRLQRHSHVDPSTRQMMIALLRYVTLLIGFMVIMQAAGINLTTFHVLAGAVGVGVGFGLQNVFSNFICGLIVMFERPVKVGDRIEVAGIEGSVIKIGARATTLLTGDNLAHIVPNQKLITEPVKNWHHHGGSWQLRIVAAVKYGSGPAEVREALLAAAKASADVAREPPAHVRLTAISGGALDFELRVWTHAGVADHADLVSSLNFTVVEELAKRRITLKE